MDMMPRSSMLGAWSIFSPRAAAAAGEPTPVRPRSSSTTTPKVTSASAAASANPCTVYSESAAMVSRVCRASATSRASFCAPMML